jgi:hypothetical protein
MGSDDADQCPESLSLWTSSIRTMGKFTTPVILMKYKQKIWKQNYQTTAGSICGVQKKKNFRSSSRTCYSPWMARLNHDFTEN